MSVNDDVHKNDDLVQKVFSRAPSMSVGGKASDQPKRAPVSQEIEAILMKSTLAKVSKGISQKSCKIYST